MKKQSKRTNKFYIAILCAVVMTIGIGVSLFFGGRAIYDNGISMGQQIEAEKISEELTTLGEAVGEKAEFQKTLEESFANLPEKVDEASIDQYINTINELSQKATNEDAKALLEGYLDKWQNFKDIYSNKDNAKIDEAWEELKAKATETASQIKSQYDAAIKSAIDNL